MNRTVVLGIALAEIGGCRCSRGPAAEPLRSVPDASLPGAALPLAVREDAGPLVASPPIAFPAASGPEMELLAKLTRGRAMGPRAFAALFQVVSKSVVNIFTSRIVRRVTEDAPEDSLSRYESLFGVQARDHLLKSLGSGFIIDARGYILTNDHVIDKAEAIRVRL